MNTVIIKITLVLLLGICLGFWLQLSLVISLLLLTGALLFFLPAFFRARKLLFPDTFFGITTTFLFLALGILCVSLNLPQNQPRHYQNHLADEEVASFHLKIVETLKPDPYSHKYLASLKSLNGNKAKGKILLLQTKDSLKTPFLEGDELLISATLMSIPEPKNPYQFNYSAYMANKKVYGQINMRTARVIKEFIPTPSISAGAAKWRKAITKALKEKDFEEEELAVVQALLLGQKHDITPEIYQNFAAAGAVHILAVSGLHVGIILLLLQWVLSPLNSLKNGKFIQLFCVLAGLWSFAILAGLSPSVVRAVTMFSFVAVGMQMKRRTSTLHAVFLSLLLLILVRPQWIWEVGFQLSYLAVISIVLFQPLLFQLYQPSGKVLKYIWSLLTVSFAAQIGVLPLSFYYFHQFPGLFFLSNLLIIPFLGIILGIGILVLFLASLDILPSFFGKFYESLISGLNASVAKIASFESFVFTEIPFSLPEVWGWYILIFSIFIFWKFFKYTNLVIVFLAIISLQLVYQYRQLQAIDELVIFHRSRNSLLGVAKTNKLLVAQNSKTPATEISAIKNYKVGAGLSEVEEVELKQIYSQKGHFLIVIDSSAVIPPNVPQKTIVLLSGSPKINLNRLIEQLNPKIIIADGSNYRFLTSHWAVTCQKREIPFHATGEKGAFIIK